MPAESRAKLATGVDLLYGRNPVLEALRGRRRIRRILTAVGAHGTGLEEIVQEARRRGIPLQEAERHRLDAVDPHHQGVVAEAAPFEYASLEEILAAVRNAASAPVLLALDSLQDPQNFGTLLRTAAAVGCGAVVIAAHRAVGVTPAVVKASAGATEHLVIVRVVNLVRALEALKHAGTWIVGLDTQAEESYDAVDLSMPLVLVVGAEGRGLGRLVREHCDLLVRLPMCASTESLNAAVAGSIVLYEAFRRRGYPGAKASAPVS